jgi:hypothetical protein
LETPGVGEHLSSVLPGSFYIILSHIMLKIGAYFPFILNFNASMGIYLTCFKFAPYKLNLAVSRLHFRYGHVCPNKKTKERILFRPFYF